MEWRIERDFPAVQENERAEVEKRDWSGKPPLAAFS
jgi:hypothetical protein